VTEAPSPSRIKGASSEIHWAGHRAPEEAGQKSRKAAQKTPGTILPVGHKFFALSGLPDRTPGHVFQLRVV
jgi:hypothetical protein